MILPTSLNNATITSPGEVFIIEGKEVIELESAQTDISLDTSIQEILITICEH